jgi:hypothetical protein
MVGFRLGVDSFVPFLRNNLMDSNDLKPVNFLINFLDVIASPGLLFQRVSTVQPKSWWFPVLFSIATPLIHVFLTLDLQIERIREMVNQRLSTMTPEQALVAQPAIERMLQPNTVLLNAAIQVVLGLVLSWMIAMLVIYFGIALSGTQIKVGGLWNAIAWSWIPLALRPLVQLGWNYYSGALIQYPGLSYFFTSGNPSADRNNPLFVASTFVDLFALWHLALIYVLLRKVGKLGSGGSFLVTLLYAGIQLVIHLLPSLVARLTAPA